MTALPSEQTLSAPTTHLSPRRVTAVGFRRQLLALVAILGYVFLYAPIIILIIYSFNDSRYSSQWAGFTLSWYKSLVQGAGVLAGAQTTAQSFTAEGVLESLRNSLLVGSVSTAISTVLGTMVALGMHRYRFRARTALDILIYLPIVIPEITMGVAMAVFFNLAFRLLNQLFGVTARPGFHTIIISHVAFSISFVALVVRARLAGMDRTLEEAAQDAGANEWQTFRRITLPLIMPGVLGGALLAFTLSLDDFVISFFTAGVGSTTLPIFVYGMIKFSVTPAINAISTLMLGLSILLVALSLLVQRR